MVTVQRGACIDAQLPTGVSEQFRADTLFDRAMRGTAQSVSLCAHVLGFQPFVDVCSEVVCESGHAGYFRLRYPQYTRGHRSVKYRYSAKNSARTAGSRNRPSNEVVTVW